MRPALDVIELLRPGGADVRYHDPYVPAIRHNGFEMAGEADLDAALRLGSELVPSLHSGQALNAVKEQAAGCGGLRGGGARSGVV